MMKLGTFSLLQSRVIILKNILLWTSFGKEEKPWANKIGFIGLFEVEWKTPSQNVVVEFLNN
jgi:hypothetical protein